MDDSVLKCLIDMTDTAPKLLRGHLDAILELMLEVRSIISIEFSIIFFCVCVFTYLFCFVLFYFIFILYFIIKFYFYYIYFLLAECEVHTASFSFLVWPNLKTHGP